MYLQPCDRLEQGAHYIPGLPQRHQDKGDSTFPKCRNGLKYHGLPPAGLRYEDQIFLIDC